MCHIEIKNNKEGTPDPLTLINTHAHTHSQALLKHGQTLRPESRRKPPLGAVHTWTAHGPRLQRALPARQP